MKVLQHSYHIIRDSIYDIGLLMKFKLTFLVVFTSTLAYLMAGGLSLGLVPLLIFAFSGFMISGSANGINQVLEKDYDSQMERTKDRPIASGRMTPSVGLLIAGMMGVSGLLTMAYFNQLAALLGAVSLILYAFIYTPLKRYSPIAVFVGAFPGALPVLVGCVAVEGYISTFALLLFAVQFFWQFPHFWAIGWLSFEDYRKAGFKLVPMIGDEIDPEIGLQSLIYTALIFPVAILFYYFNIIGLTGLILVLLGASHFVHKSYDFYRKPSDKSARSLLWAGLYFLPVIFCVLLFSVYL